MKNAHQFDESWKALGDPALLRAIQQQGSPDGSGQDSGTT
ncbi:hypothetical protein GGD70_006919 [Paraburkholderia fungorum]|nr:hypothetical protein [Paraburkholderia fungorum]